MVFTLRIPDEVRSLPPQPLFNWCTATLALEGWLGAVLYNALCKRPLLGAGVHRQILWASAGFGIGYYLRKRSDWFYAKKERDMMEYRRHHPEDFQEPEKRYMAEVLEEFHPIR
uniref:NADH dehydrogenase [ubiquinone] 1 subunit C2 n=1 Tax=Pogona vitticeps TaxID=103695 RepID=A0A6J0V4Y8_9SAUR|nr:NADH dehydrogenase [ubiquinone] 1 subunit C2-like [Pogona vitticeps]